LNFSEQLVPFVNYNCFTILNVFQPLVANKKGKLSGVVISKSAFFCFVLSLIVYRLIESSDSHCVSKSSPLFRPLVLFLPKVPAKV
jgi:hypothetical protein